MNSVIRLSCCTALTALSIGCAQAASAPAPAPAAAVSPAVSQAEPAAEASHLPAAPDAPSSALALMGVAVLLGARRFER
ncbi:exported hypothetical protein [Rubrivivax sp. A210]|uniref:hypothetical protein n=1 Tax=Rubrivivax sp. A210 TaxID=2772301 RepID=UPI001918BC2D|nr:hypothetical protein [Rubrivivax sp. A210]CAD5371599.1 exported hypothetical protein [Rubrivivax sp. A210]